MANTLSIIPLSISQVITQNTTGYTDSYDFSRCVGNATVLVKGVTGTFKTISQQCSDDGLSWYNPIDASASALGTVITIAIAGANTPVYISYSPIMTPYIRFAVTENNAGALTLTLTLIFREEL